MLFVPLVTEVRLFRFYKGLRWASFYGRQFADAVCTIACCAWLLVGGEQSITVIYNVACAYAWIPSSDVEIAFRILAL